eukprot:TRINITY_DN32847_c0_g1_i1.p1 TRINITY_DN32847_c0_g1~~TRINITY_DN32847_c0_g1_i1.p1  ORF type:complete len:595 (+),score=132.92 TRINITY_DN32847_c0_g1_i1:107-1786(+)
MAMFRSGRERIECMTTEQPLGRASPKQPPTLPSRDSHQRGYGNIGQFGPNAAGQTNTDRRQKLKSLTGCVPPTQDSRSPPEKARAPAPSPAATQLYNAPKYDTRSSGKRALSPSAAGPDAKRLRTSTRPPPTLFDDDSLTQQPPSQEASLFGNLPLAPPAPRAPPAAEGGSTAAHAVLVALLNLPAFVDAVGATMRLYAAKDVREGTVPALGRLREVAFEKGARGVLEKDVQQALREASAGWAAEVDAGAFLLELMGRVHQETLGVKLMKAAVQDTTALALTPSEPGCAGALFPTSQEEASEAEDELGTAASQQEWDAPAEFSASLVKRLFEGAASEEVTCDGCYGTVHAAPRGPDGGTFTVLSLPLGPTASSVANLMRLVHAGRGARAGLACDECTARGGRKRDPPHCVQKLKYSSLPHYLVVRLQRFHGTEAADVILKATNELTIQTELDLKPYVCDDVAFAPDDALSFSSAGELNTARRRPVQSGLRGSRSASYALRSLVHAVGDKSAPPRYVVDLEEAGGWVRVGERVAKAPVPGDRPSSTAYLAVYERVPGRRT